MQSSSSVDGLSPSQKPASRSTRLALGIALVAFLFWLAVVGASAGHGADSTQLRRGPASVVLSVLFTLGGLAGVASLAMLFWGLVTRNRRSLEGADPHKHSPILVAGLALAIFACLTALLALAARHRHVQSLSVLSARPPAHAATSTAPLPFNVVASFTTSGVIVGVVALVVIARLVRSVGWRRVVRRLHLIPAANTAPTDADVRRPRDEALSLELASLSVADAATEPDPRKAVIGCYLKMLEVAAKLGPERRRSETPAEYLRRMLATTSAARAPATSLTGLFERARYSERPVEESMRSNAIAALDALRHEVPAGAVS